MLTTKPRPRATVVALAYGDGAISCLQYDYTCATDDPTNPICYAECRRAPSLSEYDRDS